MLRGRHCGAPADIGRRRPDSQAAAMSRNAALFALVSLVWGLTWLPVKIGTQHVSPIFLAAARFMIAGALMLAWAGRDLPKVPADAWPRLIVTALMLNTGNYALLFWGAAQAPSGLAAI